MGSISPYSGTLTAEQFLYPEIRITSGLYLDGVDVNGAVDIVKKDNLFQYPTERMISRMVRACYKRLDALDSARLREALASEPNEVAKQINLYAIMCYNGLVREFMTDVIGGKYRSLDLTLPRRDINNFFTRLQGQNDDVASWSSSTVDKIKEVLRKMLVETGFLDDDDPETLIPVLISGELERGIREKGDIQALAAFNCLQ